MRLAGAIVAALRELFARLKGVQRPFGDELSEIAARCGALPTIDNRADPEILGYDDRGLPR